MKQGNQSKQLPKFVEESITNQDESFVAAQIKSAIRSQSQSQREVTRSLAGVESTLSQANLESKLAELEQRQRTSMYAGLASGVEVLSTLGEGLKQKKELEENIRIFEESLPEGVRKAGGLTTETPERASLIDVIRGKEGSLTSFLYGEEEQLVPPSAFHRTCGAVRNALLCPA